MFFSLSIINYSISIFYFNDCKTILFFNGVCGVGFYYYDVVVMVIVVLVVVVIVMVVMVMVMVVVMV